MLLDTSGLLCLLHAAEEEHVQAVSFYLAAERRLTHSYVLAEFVALAQVRGLPRRAVLDFVADLQDSAEVMVIYVDRALHTVALNLLKERADKSWSLCDAVSFILMEQQRIKDALSTDHHFEQAGFISLLRN